MLFDGDESVVYQEQRVAINENKWTGTLILTNKRIVLERMQVTKSRIPIVGKSQKNELIAFATPLTEIMKVEIIKKLIGKPVAFKIGFSGKEAHFTVSDPAVWQNQILKAKSEMGTSRTQPAPNYPPQQQYPPGYGVNINLTAPMTGTQPAPETHTIERQVIKIRCGYCGSLYDEVEPKCPSCGGRR